MAEFRHVPVMLEETLNMLNPSPNGIYVDCTLGGGGHAFALLERTTPRGMLIGFDRDKEAIAAALKRLNPFKERALLVCDNFINIKTVLESRNIKGVDGIIFDLGVSSYQLDEVERGFTYKFDGPLDMRMSRDAPITAADIVNNYSEDELTKIIKEYGEERWAQRIAEFIVAKRERMGPIERTGELVEIIKAAIPAKARKTGPHPAKRTFQALRIAVNDELRNFEKTLNDAIELLSPGGRICTITFHSLEDRIAKQTFKGYEKGCHCPPKFPVCICGKKKILKVLTTKPIVPSSQEVEINPRARSARLRVAEKI